MMGRTPATARWARHGDAAMATDYDAPRRDESDAVIEDSLDVLQERHREAQSPVVDVEETDTAEGFELPRADLSGEELSVNGPTTRLPPFGRSRFDRPTFRAVNRSAPSNRATSSETVASGIRNRRARSVIVCSHSGCSNVPAKISACALGAWVSNLNRWFRQ